VLPSPVCSYLKPELSEHRNKIERSQKYPKDMNLFYFSTVWPNSKITAAGHRVFGILSTFIKQEADIHFFSNGKRSKEELSELKEYAGVRVHHCDPNDSKIMEKVFKNADSKPDVAIFDTFVSEELYR
jgi:hypothetical protein